MGEERDREDNPEPKLARWSKVSPYLRNQAIAWEHARQQAAERGLDPGPVPVARILIELVAGDDAEIKRVVPDCEHLFDRFYAASMPVDRVDELADLETILRVHHEEPTRPALDESIPEIRASTVRNPQFPFGGTNKFTGAGVVIGIIDSGIDTLNPVFRRPDDQTKSRIFAIMDQTQMVTPPGGGPPVPTTFDQTQIDASIAANQQLIQPGQMAGGNRVETSRNDHKHGTHVAGIAAGNGVLPGNCHHAYRYVGVAPEATLVVVKHDFASGVAGLQQAIRFISDQAKKVKVGSGPAGVPAVINMSLGRATGPHDGTDPMDVMIDSYLTLTGPLLPAVVLVASAGNEGGSAPVDFPSDGVVTGGDNSHATGTIPGGNAVKTLRFALHASDVPATSGAKTVSVDIRFAAPGGLGCTVVPPGNNVSGGSNVAAPNASTSFTESIQNSSVQVTAATIPGGAANARRIVITVTSANRGKNQPGDWQLQLTNPAGAPISYHAWIAGDQFARFKDDLSQANTITSPASATQIISVGNYASSGKDKGEIAGSSSRGPRLDGQMKPDLVAPGVKIISAKRGGSFPCCCDVCCDEYVDDTGTSMSAPHVTGAIALMLERNPTLTHDDIRSILIANARRDSFTTNIPNNDYGNGKLDVLAAINAPLVRGAGATLTSALASGQAAPLTERSPRRRIPDLAEGTPLYRLLHTAEGRRIYELGKTHWEEAFALVNTEKRVAAVWHSNHGPLALHHIVRSTMLPTVPLPAEIDGVRLALRAARVVSALERFGSRELVDAMQATLPLVRHVEGKTLLELAAWLEAEERARFRENSPFDSAHA